MVGVINHVTNPDVEAAVGLARAAEEAGAAWIGIADAFWWRDVWMLLGEVASQTERIELGPAMTLTDLVFEDPDPAPIAAMARGLGVSSLAVPGFDPATVGDHVRWAASVEALLD